eukprot:gene7037-16761_t
MLLEAGAEINATGVYGDTSLMNACTSGHSNVVEMLLEAGAGIIFPMHPFGSTSLMNAGAEINAKDGFVNTSLVVACSRGHSNVVRMLL